jgi:hypothetical protein
MLVFKQILQAAAFRQAMISQFVVQFDTTWALSMCGVASNPLPATVLV